MQNIEEEEIEEPDRHEPKHNKPTKELKKIQNNRYLNQNIYQLFVQKRYAECLRMIDRCQPDQYKYYIKSLIYKHQFKLQSSLELLTQCQILNKINFTYLKGIAKNFYLLGKYKSSLEVAKDAYKLNSSDYQILFIMGKISLALKDQQNAVFNFKRSTAKEPNEQSFMELAKIQEHNGNFELAAAQLKSSLNISAENPDIYSMLGQIYLKFGQKDQAAKYFMNALERDPENYQSLFALGAINEQQQQTSQAFEYYNKAYKHSCNSASLWNNIGVNMMNKSKDIVAYCCFKRSIFLDPFRWDAHTNLAKLLMKKGKYVGAQIHIRTAIKLKPDSYLYNMLGRCLFELGDEINGEKSFEEGYKRFNDEECRCNQICLLLKVGNKDKAKRIYDQWQKEGAKTESAREKLVEINRFL